MSTAKYNKVTSKDEYQKNKLNEVPIKDIDIVFASLLPTLNNVQPCDIFNKNNNHNNNDESNIYLLKREKRSKSRVLLERKHQIMEIPKTKYKKQNKNK